MAEIYVISDTHFCHDNIISYCNRPYTDAYHMNQDMIDRWNSVVTPEDKVYHLGDVYMGGRREVVEYILSNLNGKKRLILGNHDNGKDQLLQKHFQKIDVWRMFPEYGLLLTHVPVHESTLGERTNRKGQPMYLKNIHGHIHTNPSPKGPYRCVCVEQINYTPINIKELV